ncbi:GNAT family N-acetyltransferase [Agromyces humatus]|uniref:N-acetyltransferase domain-containing protein n=1 Tax=Agromyces humatus TaxID=279573 RepID=A0ABN2KJ09_9MICO|nr:GNAT family protein [Agromyces humatus]
MADVRLVPWSDDDLATLQRGNTPEMMANLGGPETDEALAARHERYLRFWREGSARMFRIVIEGHPEGVGSIGYWRREIPGESNALECGFSVESAYQGRGIATRALLVLIADARARGETGRLWAYPRVDNVGSNAICGKAGFRLEGQEEFEYPPGNWQTSNNWVYDLAEPSPS